MSVHQLRMGRIARGLLISCGVIATGCGSDDEVGSGSLTVLLESEDVIVDGLEPGEGTEDIQDGWAVGFDKYIVAIGAIELHLATDDGVEAEAEEVFVVDLTEVPGGGLPLWSIDGLREGRWEINYETAGAAHGATRDDSVSEADYDEMVDNDWTYYVDGELTKSDGQSCPPEALAEPGDKTPNGNTSGGNDCYDAAAVRFTFGVTVETHFGPCQIDGVPGFSISADGKQTVALTIHGDHLFFNGFPTGDEGGITRLAQWLADCDLDLDGTVTREELEAIAPSQLPEIDDRYQLGGSPINPLDTMYEYLASQLKTQGHFQGEGECDVDGMEHDHGDDDHDDEDHDDH
jgi:hypothetical protein